MPPLTSVLDLTLELLTLSQTPELTPWLTPGLTPELTPELTPWLTHELTPWSTLDLSPCLTPGGSTQGQPRWPSPDLTVGQRIWIFPGHSVGQWRRTDPAFAFPVSPSLRLFPRVQFHSLFYHSPHLAWKEHACKVIGQVQRHLVAKGSTTITHA